MASKKRLDVLLTERGMAESRQKAQAIIMAGQVFWDDKRMDKPGVSVPEDANLEIRGQTLKYVSRGGLKLEKAMAQFDLPSLEGAIAIDSGASTGGFTDCMLQNGAAKVYAVDVGYGQLAWSLRQDPRVVCMERTNVRYLTQETIPEPLDFGSVDVSFISLRLILPALRPLMKETGAEDFSVYLEHIPGVFGFVGFQNEEKGIVCTHHHPSFDLDEDVLWKGTGIYVKFAVDYLSSNK